MNVKSLLKNLGKRLLAALSRNIGLKLGSLLLATILWITITGQGTDDRILRDVPYQIRNVPENLIMTDRGVGFVDIYIRGPRSMIPTIRPEDCSVFVNLPQDPVTGSMEIDILLSDVTIPYPNQVSLLQVTPQSVTVILDELITRTVQIQPLLRGSPHPDYQLGEWQVEPPDAELRGPRSYLENLETIYSEPIDIANQTMSFNERVSLKPASPLVSVIQPSRVSAIIEILDRTIERSFPEFEITVVPDTPDSSVNVSPVVVTLTISGPAATLNKIRPNDIELVVDCTNLAAGEHDIAPVLVSGYDKIVSFQVEPETITVFIPETKPDATVTPESDESAD
jgi:YbbR domain-containing protein